MKIVFIIHNLQVGGAETLVTNYLLKMKNAGHEVALIQLYNVESFLKEKLKANNIPIITIERSFGKSFLGKVFHRLFLIFLPNRKLNKSIKDFAPDIVHCHTTFPLHKIKFSPLFYTFHTDVDRTFQYSRKWFKSSLAKGLKNGLQIIALSEKIKQQTLEFFPFAKVTVIPNGVDIDFIRSQKYDRTEFLKELGIPSDAFVLGHVGRFHPVKNHEKILDVFEEVHKRNPNSYLLLVGATQNTGGGV